MYFGDMTMGVGVMVSEHARSGVIGSVSRHPTCYKGHLQGIPLTLVLT